MIVNLLIIAVLQLATAYCNTFESFLGVRALFGIGMGGVLPSFLRAFSEVQAC